MFRGQFRTRVKKMLQNCENCQTFVTPYDREWFKIRI